MPLNGLRLMLVNGGATPSPTYLQVDLSDAAPQLAPNSYLVVGHPSIAVPNGTPIRAAKAGRVIMASYNGGYGNYTCVDHGGGLSTCYAHQSGFAASTGQRVSQGQIIGYSGNTGSSTGPHLHFEVRVNGAAQDPMAYL